MPVRDLNQNLTAANLQVRLGPSQLEYLDRITELHGLNRSAVARYAISLLITTYGHDTDRLAEDIADEIHHLRRTTPTRRGRRGGS